MHSSYLFLLLAIPSMAALVALGAWIYRTGANELPGKKTRRLSDDQLRVLGYLFVLLICFAAAVYEMFLTQRTERAYEESVKAAVEADRAAAQNRSATP
jgi:cbb3-type cytochrome oxidase subunit 3